jgi:hypothetical protein
MFMNEERYNSTSTFNKDPFYFPYKIDYDCDKKYDQFEYEYELTSKIDVEYWNKRGQDGWEMVHYRQPIDGGVLIWKRKIAKNGKETKTTRLFGVYDRNENIKSVYSEPYNAFEAASKLNETADKNEYFIDWVIIK